MIETLLLVTLAFFGGRWTAPEVERLVPINVMVPVACDQPVPERPAMPTDTLDLEAQVDVQNRSMRAEIELRDGHEGRLLAALEACRQPIGKAP
jgi:hypothetical protein